MNPTDTDRQLREGHSTMPTPTDHRRATRAFIAGAAGTTIAGVLVQTLVIPTTDVADDRWSYRGTPKNSSPSHSCTSSSTF